MRIGAVYVKIGAIRRGLYETRRSLYENRRSLCENLRSLYENKAVSPNSVKWNRNHNTMRRDHKSCTAHCVTAGLAVATPFYGVWRTSLSAVYVKIGAIRRSLYENKRSLCENRRN